MTYLSDKSRTKKRRTYYSIFAIIFLVVFYFWPALRTRLYPYVEPVLISYGKSKSAASIIPSSLRTYFSSRNELSARNAELLVAVERLENSLAEKDALLREFALAGENSEHAPSATLVMYPLVRDFTSIYSSVVLSKGFKDGVEEKSLVYLRGKQPVCVITEVSDKTSLCKLLSAPGVVTEGVTASSSLILSLVGDGGGSFMADVVRDTNISVGDTIYLAHDQAMTLGTVTSITRNDQATSWRAYVRGAYSPVTSAIFYMDK